MRTESGLNAGVVHASEYIIQTLLFIGLYTHMHAHHKRTADRPGRRGFWGSAHTHTARPKLYKDAVKASTQTLKRKMRCVSERPSPRIYSEPLSAVSHISTAFGEWRIGLSQPVCLLCLG